MAASLVLGLVPALVPTLVSAGGVPATAASRGHHHHGHHGHHGHRGKVVWDSTTYTAFTAPVAAHGRVPGGRTKVRLQVKLPGGWHTFGAARSKRSGKFAVAGSLNWYGSHRVRVTTSGRHGFKRGTTVTVGMSYAPRGNPADHVFLTDRGTRYSFNPCRTIRYAVNAAEVGPTGLAIAQAAMNQVSAATGIPVKYVGTSTQLPFLTRHTRLPKGQDLLLAFATEAEYPAFVTESALGQGGPVQVRAARDGRHHRVWQTTQAAAIFDTTAWNSGRYAWTLDSTKPNWGEVMLHEVGHAFGLDHSPAADEIMFWQAGNGVYPDGHFRALYDAGDLAGLATDGLGQGCFHKVRYRVDGAARVEPPRPLP
ncbi:MAG TPA: matrixin family metalloprotease [Nocardioides sp.]|uniref:matrixin family metalloprotease n=1 Tax=Nocardioides sp. TaxID=35761 RepID=UPI002E322683|nr:matrixin family metalloprotease [Nocardioides sp.]HEX5090967.1 matrixin family metalloprotease [Nocardioides sp.]